MSLFSLIPPVYRWIGLAALVTAVGIGVPVLIHQHDVKQQQIGYDRRAAEDKAAADAQTERIRELSRAAETRYTVAAGVRERVITRTITEIRNATTSLATCPVGADAVRLLNDASRCARDDSACAGESGGAVPMAR